MGADAPGGRQRRAAVVAGGLVAAAMLVPPSAVSADAGAACTLVFGHGRNRSDDGGQVDAVWNALNRDFNRAVAAELGAGGRRIVALVLGVESSDPRAIAERLLARASDEGCDQLVETSVFGDAASGQLVARLRVHPIRRPPGPPRVDAGWMVGPASATVQRELPLTARSLDRVVSPPLAHQLATEAVARAQRPDPAPHQPQETP